MEVHEAGDFGQHFLLDRRRRRYFTFAFVRNPFERLVSCYEDRVRRSIYEPVGRHYFDSSYNHVLINRLFGDYFYREMSFDDFIGLVTRIPDWLADGHFKSQYGWLVRYGHMLPDYIGKLERLPDDWTPLAERYGLPDLPRQNPSLRENTVNYFVSEGMIELAARRYRKDIETFGYQDAYADLLSALSRGGNEQTAE
jgi:hypothetical protein